MEKQTLQNNKPTKKKEIFYECITGSVTGLVNGLFGGGGGMIVVPILTMLLNVPPKVAHATAILVILPLSVASGVFYALFGNIDFSIAIPVGIGVVVGGIIGAFLLSKLSSKIVIIIFSVVMAVAGVKMLAF